MDAPGSGDRLAARDRVTARVAAELADDPTTVGVARVDLDRYSRLTEWFGPKVATAVADVLMQRLRAAASGPNRVEPYGEDGFLLEVAVPAADNEAASAWAWDLMESLSAPVALADLPPVSVGSCVGLAVAALLDRPTAADLVGGAEIALEQAAAHGMRRAAVFDPEPAQPVGRRATLFADMYPGVLAGEFVAHLEPQVSLPDRAVVGAHAVGRWEHPVHGVVGPEEYEDEAVRSGLVRDIDDLVLRSACRAVADLPEGVALTVGVSPAAVSAPRFGERVQRVLADSGLAARQLVLALPVEGLVDLDDRAVERLSGLRALGVRACVDGIDSADALAVVIGRGLADAVALRRPLALPDGDPRDVGRAAVIAAAVESAHAAGILVVADGVASERELARAVEVGCDQARGPLLGPPAPPPPLPVV
ncbi:MAG: EAL domain-containing protein, partial [Candidatus Nanopelagicales bacterium]